MKPRKIAACAVMAALLIAVQYALSFVYGVELVTVLLLTFSYVFGAECGALCALVFSVLRCLIFGFYPNVLVLYVIYYCAFAAVFGIVAKSELPKFLCPAVLVALAVLTALCGIFSPPISALYKTRLTVLSWLLFGIFLSLSIFCFTAGKSPKSRETVSVTALAAAMTVCFTLLDDLITPLMMGYTREAAKGYFYGSFLAMLPQTVCAAVSVFVLFQPLKRALTAVYGGTRRDI